MELIPEFSIRHDGPEFKTNGMSVIGNATVNESAGQAISIFPNPATEYISVMGVTTGTTWQLFNAGGVAVESGVLGDDMKIDLGNTTPGLYTLHLAGTSQMNYLKVMIK